MRNLTWLKNQSKSLKYWLIMCTQNQDICYEENLTFSDIF